MELAPRAAEVAESFVQPLGRRWQHVRAVAARAEELEHAVAPEERDTLIAAAWLHDIGYAPEIAHTKLHPLDGARYLREQGWPDVIVNLVAHRTACLVLLAASLERERHIHPQSGLRTPKVANGQGG